MKKHALLIILFLILVPLFSETAEANLSMLAFKNVIVPVVESTTVSITRNNVAINPGQEFYISELVTESGNDIKLSDAFVITLETNRKYGINIILDFSPLINRRDSTTKIPIRYSVASTISPNPIEAEQVQSHSTWDLGGLNLLPTQTKYEYETAFAIENSSVVSVSSASNWTNATLKYEITSIKKTSRTRFIVWRSWSDWETTEMPEGEGEGLPYLGASQKISATARFDLLIAKSDYSSLIANQDYIATVRLTVESVN